MTLALATAGCETAERPAAGTAAAPAAEQGDPLPTALWVDATADLLPETAGWTNKVELADLDGDGAVDLLFANGGNYSSPGEPELNRAFLNRVGADGVFVEASREVFGDRPDLARVIKARDVNGDGRTDVFVGTTYQTPSRLLLSTEAVGTDATGSGLAFDDVSASHLPDLPLSLGDAEFGDMDGDGDLDLVLADWGPGNNMTNAGGRTRLWLNDGTGRFTDATAARMPDALVRFSWELDVVDVDNDFDLDVVISCKRCPESLLLKNDGTGTFEVDRRGLPGYTNNYEFEAMDLDGDGYLDLVTINDGEIVDGIGSSRREHVFMNNGEGRFRDATAVQWPPSENLGEDDNMVAFLDFDQDGDADFVIGSLSGPDRLMINDGRGNLRLASEVFEGAETPGTLGLALADLDGDGRLDVVQAQGEHPEATEERIYLGVGLPPDTLGPVIGPIGVTGGVAAGVDGSGEDVGGARAVLARIHDRKSPTLAAEWQEIALIWTLGGETARSPMTWFGEFLWRATAPAGVTDLRICATDFAGNQTCSEVGAG